jgi:thiosulfate dehydrogenase
MGRILLGIILCLILLPIVVLAWLRFGHPPVAVADAPFPHERQIVQIPLNARMNREKPGSAPIQADAGNLTAGAQVYSDQCAVCHGFNGRPSTLGPSMYPAAPQFWQPRKNSNAPGASEDRSGEIYWTVFNGIRLTGMPEFNSTLTQTEIWQVALLLANDNKPLPPAAAAIVRGEIPPDTTPTTPAPVPSR